MDVNTMKKTIKTLILSLLVLFSSPAFAFFSITDAVTKPWSPSGIIYNNLNSSSGDPANPPPPPRELTPEEKAALEQKRAFMFQVFMYFWVVVGIYMVCSFIFSLHASDPLNRIKNIPPELQNDFIRLTWGLSDEELNLFNSFSRSQKRQMLKAKKILRSRRTYAKT